ncbi:hypothetical protein PBI_GRAYSON_9 [Rhodococcus phage Grayson]|nr:hypothetical protein PBI_GRAYSON_9 [Rhodococcus phage Grayson]
MKIEEVVPVVEPDYVITLNKFEYNQLIVTISSLRGDPDWSKEYHDFFNRILDAHGNV